MDKSFNGSQVFWGVCYKQPRAQDIPIEVRNGLKQLGRVVPTFADWIQQHPEQYQNPAGPPIISAPPKPQRAQAKRKAAPDADTSMGKKARKELNGHEVGARSQRKLPLLAPKPQHPMTVNGTQSSHYQPQGPYQYHYPIQTSPQNFHPSSRGPQHDTTLSYLQTPCPSEPATDFDDFTEQDFMIRRSFEPNFSTTYNHSYTNEGQDKEAVDPAGSGFAFIDVMSANSLERAQDPMVNHGSTVTMPTLSTTASNFLHFDSVLEGTLNYTNAEYDATFHDLAGDDLAQDDPVFAEWTADYRTARNLF